MTARVRGLTPRVQPRQNIQRHLSTHGRAELLKARPSGRVASRSTDSALRSRWTKSWAQGPRGHDQRRAGYRRSATHICGNCVRACICVCVRVRARRDEERSRTEDPNLSRQDRRKGGRKRDGQQSLARPAEAGKAGRGRRRPARSGEPQPHLRHQKAPNAPSVAQDAAERSELAAEEMSLFRLSQVYVLERRRQLEEGHRDLRSTRLSSGSFGRRRDVRTKRPNVREAEVV